MSYTKLGCLGTDVVTKLANLRKDLSLESYIMSDTMSMCTLLWHSI